ncbi:hypothetical protein SXCC_02359 [Gluconacetobacter sp. SXCC-1]|nr:hypothetical protein SXCC_02359 [Gluconacetobacter sp. SXCC-1]
MTATAISPVRGRHHDTATRPARQRARGQKIPSINATENYYHTSGACRTALFPGHGPGCPILLYYEYIMVSDTNP